MNITKDTPKASLNMSQGFIVPPILETQKHHDLPAYHTANTVRWRVGDIFLPWAISDMTCAFFEDLPDVRFMAGKFMEKIWFKWSKVFDTSANAPSPEEAELIRKSDIVITDINDTNNIDDPSGGLRRGEMALAQGKIVIFVTGNAYNETMIHAKFAAKFAGQYAFMTKPFNLKDIKETTERLIARRGDS